MSYVMHVLSVPTETHELKASRNGDHDPFGSSFFKPPNGSSKSDMGQYASYGHMCKPFVLMQKSTASS
eukprot:CAMPEP_0201664916 /NCGR_PEP_ID=MMETSP0494-20130426/6238_1 /ASSEMBLY_ACC=CAM_ASM_000839 /TAXON_ID=420259 /ORGANISM="Thalassiosira gravida, Strain GMp14c1" /LENGTH=67 /DNA_ID=CAMNT_0048143775 /DNA_START=70 /DNA_END=273 /DNA_ORIENTATION=-